MSRIKKIFLRILLFVLIISGVLYFFYSLANENRIQALRIVLTDRDRMNPPLALQKLELAQREWPLFYFDKNFQNLLNTAKEVNNRPAVIVFMKEETTEAKISKLIEEVKNVKGVKDAKFVSKEEALGRYRDANKNDPQLLELVSPAILPPSIEIYLDDFDVRSQVVNMVKKTSFVEYAL